MANVYTRISDIPILKNAVITIGSFDGVHGGHRHIFETMNKIKQKIKGETVLITFDPHPRKIVQGGTEPTLLLTQTNEKIKLLERAGIDTILILPFSKVFAEQRPEEYIQNFLLKLHPHTIVIGYDHRFGIHRSGDINLLKAYSKVYDYEVEEIAQHLVDDIAVSSTKIRKALLAGDLKTASQLLTYPYSLEGTVEKGEQIGTKIGFPTANLALSSSEKLIPNDGIYAVNASIDGIGKYKGMLYIGSRPTIADGLKKTIEVHLFDFPYQYLYGKKIWVEFLAFIRSDEKFKDLEALQKALENDKRACLMVFNGPD